MRHAGRTVARARVAGRCSWTYIARVMTLAAIRGFRALPATVRGAILMTGASMCFAGMIGIIRHLNATESIHAFELAFFRNLFGLMFMLPWLVRGGIGGLKTRRIGLYTFRGALGITAMLTWFWAITAMPLADAVALSFTLPIFATVLAAVVLHEVVRARRWTATVIGFLGVLVILRPGFEDVNLAAGVVLLSSLAMAASVITIKSLSKTEPIDAIVTWMVIYLTPMSLVAALFVWTTPPAHVWPWLIALGGLATLGHQFMTRGFKLADTSALMPFDFLRLPFVAAIAWVFFGEVADIWTWAGAAIIFGASAYITYREAQSSGTRPATEAKRQRSNLQ